MQTYTAQAEPKRSQFWPPTGYLTLWMSLPCFPVHAKGTSQMSVIWTAFYSPNWAHAGKVHLWTCAYWSVVAESVRPFLACGGAGWVRSVCKWRVKSQTKKIWLFSRLLDSCPFICIQRAPSLCRRVWEAAEQIRLSSFHHRWVHLYRCNLPTCA